MNDSEYVEKGVIMGSRRFFLRNISIAVSAVLTALLAAACGRKPDAETEPSPEWPPKDE